MFCSSEVSAVMHPLEPLTHHMLVCGQHFDTSMVKDALKVRRELTVGVVVIDGDEATLGTMAASMVGSSQSAKVAEVARFHANIASRTRRGGQSATRYSRNRDGE